MKYKEYQKTHDIDKRLLLTNIMDSICGPMNKFFVSKFIELFRDQNIRVCDVSEYRIMLRNQPVFCFVPNLQYVSTEKFLFLDSITIVPYAEEFSTEFPKALESFITGYEAGNEDKKVLKQLIRVILNAAHTKSDIFNLLPESVSEFISMQKPLGIPAFIQEKELLAFKEKYSDLYAQITDICFKSYLYN